MTEFIHVEKWFPTPIFFQHLQFDCKPVAEKCLELRKLGHSNGVVSNVGGWQSTNINLNDFEEFFIVRDVLASQIKILSTNLGAELCIGNLWININDKGCYNVKHIHNACAFSGAIYIQTDETTGDITFYNDHSPINYYEFEPNNSEIFHQKVTYKPKDGMVLFFPAWIPHSVEVSNSNKPRISMSFNLKQKFSGS